MAGTYETDFVDHANRVRDVRTKAIEQYSMDAPVTSMLPKGPGPQSSTPEWGVKTYNNARTTGVAEGSAGTSQSNTNNTKFLKGRYQKMDRNPEVTKESKLLVRQYTEKKNVFESNAADCFTELTVDIEATVLSDNESVPADNSDLDNKVASKTRGILRWLSNADGRFSDTETTPHSTLRTKTNEIVASKTNATDVLESDITGLVTAVATARKKDGRTLVGVNTPAMAEVIDGYSIKTNAGEAFATFPVYGWEQKLGEINREVKMIKTSLGRVALMVSFQLDSSVAHMVLLDREMAELQYAQKPMLVKDPNTTVREYGVLDVLFVNAVLNPQAHGKIIVGSTK